MSAPQFKCIHPSTRSVCVCSIVQAPPGKAIRYSSVCTSHLWSTQCVSVFHSVLLCKLESTVDGNRLFMNLYSSSSSRSVCLPSLSSSVYLSFCHISHVAWSVCLHIVSSSVCHMQRSRRCGPLLHIPFMLYLFKHYVQCFKRFSIITPRQASAAYAVVVHSSIAR